MRKVFVSSVVGGFEIYRDAMRQAITLMGDKPIMCEDFGARPTSSEVACLGEVENSDVFVAALGDRFGFEKGGVSVSQAEFRRAVKMGKPVLAFVLKGAKMDAKQLAFRREVEDYASGVFRGEFADANGLKDSVVKALRQLEMNDGAASQKEFEERVKDASSRVLRGKSSSGYDPNFVLSFWPQPNRRIVIDEIEAELQDRFAQLGNDGALRLKDGYEDIKAATWVGIESGKTRIVFYEDGLILAEANPEIERDRDNYVYVGHYASPKRMHALAKGISRFCEGRGAWVGIELTGMGMAQVGEPPVGKGSGSFSVPSRYGEDVDFRERKLLVPFDASSYMHWVDDEIRRMARKYRSGSN